MTGTGTEGKPGDVEVKAGTPEMKASGRPSEGAPGKQEFKKGEFKKGDFKKGDFNRSVKRSDNPDVIYGRDFEEEAIPIEEIIGDMGEVRSSVMTAVRSRMRRPF